MAHDSPFSPKQLLKNNELDAEKKCPNEQACPTKQRSNATPSVNEEPDEIIKSSQITP